MTTTPYTHSLNAALAEHGNDTHCAARCEPARSPAAGSILLVKRTRSVVNFLAARRRKWTQSRPSGSPRPIGRSIRVVIADRSPIFLHGLRSLLNAEKDFVVVAMRHDAAGCIAAIRLLAPDLVVFGMHLTDTDGIQMLNTILTDYPRVRPVLLASLGEIDDSTWALAIGACGIIPREIGSELLVRGLRQVASGQQFLLLPTWAVNRRTRGASQSSSKADLERRAIALTVREQQIIKLVAAGLSNKEIGERLDIRETTVKVHLNHIFQKLAIRRRKSLLDLVARHPPFPRTTHS